MPNRCQITILLYRYRTAVIIMDARSA